MKRILSAALLIAGLALSGPEALASTLRIALQEDPDVLDPAQGVSFVGRVVFAGAREQLLRHGDVKEFYLGQKEERERGYRDVKQYRRIRRWH